MRLSWNVGYEDYTDEKNWLPRLAQLRSFAQNLDPRTLYDREMILDGLETLEELMRFECYQQDMGQLEPVMRKYSALLERVPEGETAAAYFKMLFLRINGMLYRSVGQNRKAQEQYDLCTAEAWKCFLLVAEDGTLSGDQRFYVGWNCVECFRESAEVRDLLMDVKGAMEVLRPAMHILNWLDGGMTRNPGIGEKAAAFYQNAAGLYWQNGDPDMGRFCFQSASRMFNLLDQVHGSDFYRARAIWSDSIHGIMAATLGDDPGVMLQCEQEAEAYSRQRPYASPRDKAIVNAARAAAVLQRSVAFQQNGQPLDAIAVAQEGTELLEESLQTLLKELKRSSGYYHTVLDGIAARIHNSLVGAQESLAVMYYQNEEPEEAEPLLRTVLERLTDKNGYRPVGAAGVLLQAETLQYLSLIASDEGNINEADFYGVQGADMALTLARETGNPMAWVMGVVCCSIVSELALNMKNKPKAGRYADMGLEACDALARLVPDHPHLTLRDTLAGFKRKASRKFF